MFLHDIKLSLRLLVRNPFMTFVKIAGLSVGFAVFYILWPYTQSELRVDQFHEHPEQIFRLARHLQWTEPTHGVNDIKLTANHCGIMRSVTEGLKEVSDFTRVTPQQILIATEEGLGTDLFVTVHREGGDKQFFPEQALAFAEGNFFRFFSFPLLKGDPSTILEKPGTAALSRKCAGKYFGNADPIGKVIYLNDSTPLTVTGVFEDLPRNTHMLFDILLSSSGIEAMNQPSLQPPLWWGYCYVRVQPGTSRDELIQKIDAAAKKYYENCTGCTGSVSTVLQSLEDVSYDNFGGNFFRTRSYSLLVILSILAFVILAIAWINYVTLSMSMLNKRLVEMGTRKAVGASVPSFVRQFFIDAAMVNVLSLLVAFTLVQLTRGATERLFEFYIVDWSELPASTMVISGATFIAGIVVTGIYPVSITCRKKALDLLKRFPGGAVPEWSGLLVTAQYTAAIGIIGWVSTINAQLNYIMHKDLGVERENVVIVDCPLNQPSGFDGKLDFFMTQSLKIAGIRQRTASKSVPGDLTGYGMSVRNTVSSPEFGLDTNGGVDEDFLSFYNIPLLAGRDFQSNNSSDREAILISRDACARFGFVRPEDAVGAKLLLPWYGNAKADVIGVYDDYEFRPLFTEYSAGNMRTRGSFLTYKAFLIPDYFPSRISFKVKHDDAHAAILKLEQLFREVFPQDIFRWTMLNEHINRHYADEEVSRNQILLFATLAVGIACLGLLGMVTNRAIEKTKEFGIRKVLGARILQIAQLLVRSTLVQVMLAAMIGVPLSYYLAHQYLEKFVDRVALNWWHHLIPIGVLVLFMFATIVSVLVRAANTNPVASLRHE